MPRTYWQQHPEEQALYVTPVVSPSMRSRRGAKKAAAAAAAATAAATGAAAAEDGSDAEHGTPVVAQASSKGSRAKHRGGRAAGQAAGQATGGPAGKPDAASGDRRGRTRAVPPSYAHMFESPVGRCVLTFNSDDACDVLHQALHELGGTCVRVNVDMSSDQHKQHLPTQEHALATLSSTLCNKVRGSPIACTNVGQHAKPLQEYGVGVTDPMKPQLQMLDVMIRIWQRVERGSLNLAEHLEWRLLALSVMISASQEELAAQDIVSMLSQPLQKALKKQLEDPATSKMMEERDDGIVSTLQQLLRDWSTTCNLAVLYCADRDLELDSRDHSSRVTFRTAKFHFALAKVLSSQPEPVQVAYLRAFLDNDGTTAQQIQDAVAAELTAENSRQLFCEAEATQRSSGSLIVRIFRPCDLRATQEWLKEPLAPKLLAAVAGWWLRHQNPDKFLNKCPATTLLHVEPITPDAEVITRRLQPVQPPRLQDPCFVAVFQAEAMPISQGTNIVNKIQPCVLDLATYALASSHRFMLLYHSSGRAERKPLELQRLFQRKDQRDATNETLWAAHTLKFLASRPEFTDHFTLHPSSASFEGRKMCSYICLFTFADAILHKRAVKMTETALAAWGYEHELVIQLAIPPFAPTEHY